MEGGGAQVVGGGIYPMFHEDASSGVGFHGLRLCVRVNSSPLNFCGKSGPQEIGCGDSEPGPASLARSCPRSFRSASVARFGQDDNQGDLEPVPASLTRSCPRSFRSGHVAPFGQDDNQGDLEPVPASLAPSCPGPSAPRALLASVRMTELALLVLIQVADFRGRRCSLRSG